MLILSRRQYERIWIGDSVLLTVIAVKNGRVRLAFEAPADIAIDREELRNRSQECAPGADESVAEGVENAPKPRREAVGRNKEDKSLSLSRGPRRSRGKDRHGP